MPDDQIELSAYEIKLRMQLALAEAPERLREAARDFLDSLSDEKVIAFYRQSRQSESPN